MDVQLFISWHVCIPNAILLVIPYILQDLDILFINRWFSTSHRDKEDILSCNICEICLYITMSYHKYVNVLKV